MRSGITGGGSARSPVVLRPSPSGTRLGLAAPCVQDRRDGSGYRRHRPEETALYRVVEAQWPSFRERADERGGLPRFVSSEFDESLRCGRLEYGCLPIACAACGFLPDVCIRQWVCSLPARRRSGLG